MYSGFKFEHVFLDISFQRKLKVKTNRQKQDFTKITGKSLDKRSLKRYMIFTLKYSAVYVVSRWYIFLLRVNSML